MSTGSDGDASFVSGIVVCRLCQWEKTSGRRWDCSGLGQWPEGTYFALRYQMVQWCAKARVITNQGMAYPRWWHHNSFAGFLNLIIDEINKKNNKKNKLKVTIIIITSNLRITQASGYYCIPDWWCSAVRNRNWTPFRIFFLICTKITLTEIVCN